MLNCFGLSVVAFILLSPPLKVSGMPFRINNAILGTHLSKNSQLSLMHDAAHTMMISDIATNAWLIDFCHKAIKP